MKTFTITLIALSAGLALSQAPAPFPARINSRVLDAPPVSVFRGTERTFRATFTDGATASDVSDYTPFMSWSTSSVAVAVSTSRWSFVNSGTNGIVDFTFSPASVNHAAGRYGYEIGVKDDDGNPRTYAQGVFTIRASPVGAGVDPVTWTTPANWNLIDWSNLPDYQTGTQVGVTVATYSNHVRQVYVRGVEVEPGVFQLYQGD